MIRAALPLALTVAMLAACSSTPAPTRHESSRRPAAGGAGAAVATGTPAAPSTAVPSRSSSAAAAATPVPAGHTGHVAPATASGPMPLHPPAAGTYAYTMTDDSGAHDVTVAASAMQGTTDTLTWHSSSGSRSGQLDMTLSWPGTGASINQVVLHTGTVSYTCVLSPAVELAPSPLAVGDSWSSDSTCSAAGGTLHWTEQDRDTGTDVVQVGGASVLTALISVSRTLTFTSTTTTFTSTTSSSDWFAPSLGLEVRDESTTTSSSGGTGKTSTSTLQLDSTQPQ